jgi:hypothetical protein
LICCRAGFQVASENHFIPEHHRLIQAALMTALYFFPFGQSVLLYMPDRLIALNQMSSQGVFPFGLPDSGILQRWDNPLIRSYSSMQPCIRWAGVCDSNVEFVIFFVFTR